MHAELNTDSAQHQKPQHHHERKVETAEAGSIKLREGEVECAAGGEQPDFVSIPHGPDGAQYGATLAISLGSYEVNDAGAQIKPV